MTAAADSAPARLADTAAATAVPAAAPESMPGATAAATLSLPGLEAVYDALARAIDEAGPDKTELFLVKLALLDAHALADAERFERHLRIALQDL